MPAVRKYPRDGRRCAWNSRRSQVARGTCQRLLLARSSALTVHGVAASLPIGLETAMGAVAGVRAGSCGSAAAEGGSLRARSRTTSLPTISRPHRDFERSHWAGMPRAVLGRTHARESGLTSRGPMLVLGCGRLCTVGVSRFIRGAASVTWISSAASRAEPPVDRASADFPYPHVREA